MPGAAPQLFPIGLQGAADSSQQQGELYVSASMSMPLQPRNGALTHMFNYCREAGVDRRH